MGFRLQEHTCKNCGKTYQNKDVRGLYCKTCLTTPGICKCGCGGKTRNVFARYLAGHKTRGKKYKEIYGTDNPANGFRKGDDNVAKRFDIRQKISEGVKNSYDKYPHLRAMRFEELNKNFSSRRFSDGKGNLLKSQLELELAGFMQKEGIEYEYEHPLHVKTRIFFPDFTIGNTLIELCGFIIDDKTLQVYKERIKFILENTENDVIVVTYAKYVKDFLNLGNAKHLDVILLPEARIQTVNIENICNVDYSHFLSFHKGKCKNFHSHSSYGISLEIEGVIEKKIWIEDFGVIKKVVKKAISKIDHKTIVNSKHVVKRTDSAVFIEYVNENGVHKFELPKEEVFEIEEEPSLENIAGILSNTILEELPGNIISIALHMKEGVGGGIIYSVGRPYYAYEDIKRIIKFHVLLRCEKCSKTRALSEYYGKRLCSSCISSSEAQDDLKRNE